VVKFSRGIKGHLRIAASASDSAITECLPADLATFSQAHPGIRISLPALPAGGSHARGAARRGASLR